MEYNLIITRISCVNVKWFYWNFTWHFMCGTVKNYSQKDTIKTYGLRSDAPYRRSLYGYSSIKATLTKNNFTTIDLLLYFYMAVYVAVSYGDKTRHNILIFNRVIPTKKKEKNIYLSIIYLGIILIIDLNVTMVLGNSDLLMKSLKFTLIAYVKAHKLTNYFYICNISMIFSY